MKQFRDTNYEVSEDGIIINTKTQHIKSIYLKDGIKMASLSIKNKRFQAGVHRIVAETYLNNFTPDCIIDFKDQDKTNTHYSNLYVKPGIKFNRAMNNYQVIPVSQYSLDGEFIRDFKSINEASKYLYKSSSTAFRYALKHSGNYQGYHWKINNQLEILE